MQILFERGEEHGVITEGIGLLPGAVTRLAASRVPHMGWNTVTPAAGSILFAGLGPQTRFYFVHSYAARPTAGNALISITDHGGDFIAAIERGPLAATQFHPEKSGDAGATLLRNWVQTL
jgi:glutamine amidotransferase